MDRLKRIKWDLSEYKDVNSYYTSISADNVDWLIYEVERLRDEVAHTRSTRNAHVAVIREDVDRLQAKLEKAKEAIDQALEITRHSDYWNGPIVSAGNILVQVLADLED